jgi:hypothetical protein
MREDTRRCVLASVNDDSDVDTDDPALSCYTQPRTASCLEHSSDHPLLIIAGAGSGKNTARRTLRQYAEHKTADLFPEDARRYSPRSAAPCPW